MRPLHAGLEAVAGAYAACERLARHHYENFPVASLLLPAAMRPHIAAIYAFARAADDFADEGDLPPAERLALLDDWGSTGCAHRVRRDRWDDVIPIPNPEPRIPSTTPSSSPSATPSAPVRCRSALFEDLLSAFRQDVVTTRYATWAEVMDYCRRSANPVGRLVLRVAGARGPTRSIALPTRCARRSSSPTSGRTSSATG